MSLTREDLAQRVIALASPVDREVALAALTTIYAPVSKDGTDTLALQGLSREDPRDFVRDVLGAKASDGALRYGLKDPWTHDQELVMLSVRDNRRTAVPSGHGVGKTRVAAWIVLWYLFRAPGTVVITTAPTARQVEELLWGEIRQAFARSATALLGRLLQTKLEVAEKWLALGITTSTRTGDISATRFQGFHAPNMLVVLDEATGVAPEIWEGVEGIALRPTDRLLAIGNPTDPGSRFHASCTGGGWNVIRLDCRNHPNVLKDDADIVPGAVTREWVAEKLEEYGGEDTPLFQAKVAGIWPTQSSDALIQVAWIESAQRKWDEDEVEDGMGVVLGLDVAGEGTDLTPLWKIEKAKATIPVVAGRRAWHQGRDITHATDLAAAAIRETNASALALDDTGLGQGVSANLNRMMREGTLQRVHLIRVNFGASPVDGRFQYAKDELWWHGRETLRRGGLALPSDAHMRAWGLPKGQSVIAQLTSPIYDSAGPGGRVRVFDKRGAHGAVEKTRHLPAGSPDLAHGFLLANLAWVRTRADVTLLNPPKDQVEQHVRGVHDGIRERLLRASDRKKRGGGTGMEGLV